MVGNLGHNNLTMGGDPELFLFNKKTGRHTDAARLLPGKDAPIKFSTQNEYQEHNTSGAMHSDGFLAEFTINPSYCRLLLMDNMQICLYRAMQKLPTSVHLDPSTATVELTKDELGDLHESSKIFGCEKDFCAYSENGSAPRDASDFVYRSSGGHLHFNIGTQGKEVMEKVVKMLDILVAVPAVTIARQNGMEKLRRTFYGRAGSYRIKTARKNGYDGLEYRTLSNFFMMHRVLFSWVYGQARAAIQLIMKPSWSYNESQNKDIINNILKICPSEDAEKIINNADFESAMAVTKELIDLPFWSLGSDSGVPWAKKQNKDNFLFWAKNNLTEVLVQKYSNKPLGMMYHTWNLNKNYGNQQNNNKAFEEGFGLVIKELKGEL